MSELDKVLTEYRSLQLEEIQNYGRYNELLFIHSSSVMEGSTLTLDETEMLIEENLTPKGRPLEHSLMIKDHYDALNYVIAQSKNPETVTEGMIKKIGSLVMKSTGGEYHSALGTVDSRLGDYRKSASRAAGGSYYVNHEKIESMIGDMVAGINGSMNKVASTGDIMTLSSYAHLQLLTIHPFVDGNGRSARLLQNLILLKHQMPLLIIRHEKKSDYISAIKMARDKEGISPFNAFIEKEFCGHLKREIDKAEAMKKGKSKGLSFTINV